MVTITGNTVLLFLACSNDKAFWLVKDKVLLVSKEFCENAEVYRNLMKKIN